MDMPSELRWIGPLFAGLFIVMWLRRGFLIFLYMAIYSWPLIVAPVMLALLLITIETGGRSPRYIVIALVTYLSFFSSGILIEPIPIPYTGGIPPPPMMPVPTILLTPFHAIFSLFFSFSFHNLLSVIGSVLLILLPIITFFVTRYVTDGKLEAAQAVLLYVLIILCWTFYFIPLSFSMGSSSFLTPIPLGPLVALNILPWVKIDSTDSNSVPDTNSSR